jgi:hypothetical protein
MRSLSSGATPHQGNKKAGSSTHFSVSPINQPAQLYAIYNIGQAHIGTCVSGLPAYGGLVLRRDGFTMRRE